MNNTATKSQSKIKVRNKVYKIIETVVDGDTTVLTLRTLSGKSDNFLYFTKGQDFAMWQSSRAIVLGSAWVALDVITELTAVV